MNCSNCGEKIDHKSRFCAECGTPTSTKEKTDNLKYDDSNARIFGIFSLIFSLIPIVGLVFGIIATQKGRKGRSQFASFSGWTGIVLSLTVAVAIGWWRYDQAKQLRYSNCLEEKSSANRELLARNQPILSGAMQQCASLEP